MKGKFNAKTKGRKTPVSHGHIPKDLKQLKHDELSGYENKEVSLAASSTDESEDEGLGDGNMGRSQKDILEK